MRWFGRVRRSGEIAYLRRRGRAMHLETFAVYGSEAASGGPRVCVTVSKAVGIAVVRNRIRRQLRGALDASAPAPGRIRYLFVVKPAAATLGYDALARDVARALTGLAARA